jgi:hypothetical protein
MNEILLPGQPVPPVSGQGPAPKYGAGTFERDNVIRASLVGSLENKGGVRATISYLLVQMYVIFMQILLCLAMPCTCDRRFLYHECARILRKKAASCLEL